MSNITTYEREQLRNVAYSKKTFKQIAYDEYRVTDVDSVAEFLDKYYKPERYTGRGEDYADTLLTSYQRRLAKNGYCFMSHHDSVNGRVNALFESDLS